MKSKLLLILILSGLLLARGEVSQAQTPYTLKIIALLDIIGLAPKEESAQTTIPVPGKIDLCTILKVVEDYICGIPGARPLELEFTADAPAKMKIKGIDTGLTIDDVKGSVKIDFRQFAIDNLGAIGSALSLAVQAATFTIESGSGAGVFTLQNPLQAESFQELVENIINFIWVISLVVTPLMILIAGFLFLTAGGQPNQITSAKKMIFWTILGFVIITLAEGIIAMLKGILGG